MPRLILLRLLAVTYSCLALDAQQPNAQPVHITGIVVDQHGEPVKDAGIYDAKLMRHLPETNARGEFELHTVSPAFVVRKVGFRAERIRVNGPASVRVTLHSLGPDGNFPKCGPSPAKYLTVSGGYLMFPKLPGLKATRQGADVDYVVRFYSLRAKSGKASIMHGHGGMWSMGSPSDKEVWTSPEYHEIDYDLREIMVVDARGRQADGKYWRYVGKFGESASYSDVNESQAKALDQVLDRACSYYGTERSNSAIR